MHSGNAYVTTNGAENSTAPHTHYSLLHYVYVRVSNRHEKACTCSKQNGNDAVAAPLTPEQPGTAHQCHFFSCHSKKGGGLIHSAAAFVGRGAILMSFQG